MFVEQILHFVRERLVTVADDTRRKCVQGAPL